MRRMLVLSAALFVLSVAPARAAAGHVVFDGGTPAERAQVTGALAASTFDFDRLPAVTVHIRRGIATESQGGHVWIDARLLEAGRFAWASVLDEFAHQIDFFLLDDAKRAQLNAALGGKDWCYGVHGLAHGDYGCERFSSVFAWAYWQSADNAYRPKSARDESAAMPVARFRVLVGSMLGVAQPASARAPR